jgi:hypothetical protein
MMLHSVVLAFAVLAITHKRSNPLCRLRIRSHTAVEATYTRIALQPAANEDVCALGDKDRHSGSDWQRSIERCLDTSHC